MKRVKNIKLTFDKQVSDINKNVAVEPVTKGEVIDQLNKKFNLGIKAENCNMEMNIDTLG